MVKSGVKVIVAICSLVLLFLGSSSAYANTKTMNYNVDLAATLSLTLSDAAVNLDLIPDMAAFNSKDVTATVSTNNVTGYEMTMTGTGTDLVMQNDNTKTIPTLPALEGGYTENSFLDNKWGVKIGNGNYNSFVSGATIATASTAVNDDATVVGLAAKVNINQTPGVYENTLNFYAVGNIAPDYIQNLDSSLCTSTASIVLDARDGNTYQVRRLSDGNCWMVQNLRFGGDKINSVATNINESKTLNWGDLAESACYSSYDSPCYHDSGNITNGYWYNYAGASGMTITGSAENTNTAQYSICPAGWRLPTNDEMVAVSNYTAEFFNDGEPVRGGVYNNGIIPNANLAVWWAATAPNGQSRRALRFDGGSLVSNVSGARTMGYYVRCVLAP